MESKKGGSPLAGRDVGIANVTDKTLFTSTTDNKGYAYFWVQINKKYDIDIDGKLNVSWADMPDDEGFEIQKP